MVSIRIGVRLGLVPHSVGSVGQQQQGSLYIYLTLTLTVSLTLSLILTLALTVARILALKET